MATKPPTDRAAIAELPTPTPLAMTVVKRHPIKLHTADDIRMEMARVYREMRSGGLETQQGTRLVYVLGELRKVYETCVIEARMTALEASGDLANTEER